MKRTYDLNQIPNWLSRAEQWKADRGWRLVRAVGAVGAGFALLAGAWGIFKAIVDWALPS